MKVTLLQLKQSFAPQLVNLPACDARFVALANDAIQRLVMGPEKWWNLTYTYRLTVTSGLITWPREIATIEAIASCGYPMPIRSEWFEYVDGGYGLRDPNAYCGTNDLSQCRWDRQAFDRPMSCVFQDIDATGNPKRLKFYTDCNASAGAVVTYHGLDWDGNPITESVTLAYPGAVTSVNTVSRIDSIILPGTLTCSTRLFQYDTVALTQVAIGIYQGDETCPSYRRTFVGALCNNCSTVVTVKAKREFAPASKDTDVLLLGSIPAITEMMQAVQARQKQNFQAAIQYEQKAFEILDREASHYIGFGANAPLQIVSGTWGGGGLPNLY